MHQEADYAQAYFKLQRNSESLNLSEIMTIMYSQNPA